MLVLKLQLHNDIRRIQVEDNLTYDALLAVAKATFGEKEIPEKPVLKYRDNENDLITVTKNEELQEALRLSKENASPSKVLKIIVSSSSDCLFFDNDCNFNFKALVEKFEKKKNEFCRRRKECFEGRRGGGCSKFKKFAFFGLIAFLFCRCCLFWLLPLFLIACIVKKCVLKGWKGCGKSKKCGVKRACKEKIAEVVSKIEQQIPIIIPNEEIVSSDEEIEVANESNNQKELPFQSKLTQLEEMGFLNRGRNIELLIQNAGDVLKTVKQLLDKQQ